MVDGVADDVRDRVLDRLGERLVELCVLAFHDDGRLLLAGDRQVADDPGQLCREDADRLHPRLHHAFLQLGRDRVEPVRAGLEGHLVAGETPAEELVAGEHQLANEVHQHVEQPDIHANRRVAEPRSRCGDRFGGRLGRARRRGELRRELQALGLILVTGGELGRPGLRWRELRFWPGLTRLPGRLRRLGDRLDGGKHERLGPAEVGPILGLRAGLVRLLQCREAGDQRGVVALAFGLRGLDRRQDASHGIDERQEPADDRRRRLDLTLAKPAEQLLALVRHCRHLEEAEESRGALDRVDDPENGTEQRLRARLTLQREQVRLDLCQTFLALHQVVFDEFFEHVLYPQAVQSTQSLQNTRFFAATLWIRGIMARRPAPVGRVETIAARFSSGSNCEPGTSDRRLDLPERPLQYPGLTGPSARWKEWPGVRVGPTFICGDAGS